MARLSKNDKTAKSTLKNAREAIKAATKAAKKASKASQKDAAGLRSVLDKGLAGSPKKSATTKKAASAKKAGTTKKAASAKKAGTTKKAASAKKADTTGKKAKTAKTAKGKDAATGKASKKDKTATKTAKAGKGAKAEKAGSSGTTVAAGPLVRPVATSTSMVAASQAPTAPVLKLPTRTPASATKPTTSRGRRKSTEPTLLQLRAAAKSAGLTGFSRLNKTDLQKLLASR
jgi:hypothetical protein